MPRLDLNLLSADRPTILCLGAHSDDIEIGALATLLELAEAKPEAEIVWVVFSASGDREAEARASAEYCTKGFADRTIETHAFDDGLFPSAFAALKRTFEALRQRCDPDLVFTHHRDDRHQDHRLVSDVTWQTFRDHLVLEYEIPKYDGDLGRPNVYHPVTGDALEKKLDALERFFGSQRSKGWFDRETFRGLMRLRGVECRADSGYAEAFYGRKIVI